MASKRLLIVAFVTMILLPTTWARSGKVYKFRGGAKDGFQPSGGLVSDGAGVFYGVTAYGGKTRQNDYGCGNPGNTCGTVFKLSRNQSGVWTETIIYEFTGGTDGSVPAGSLVFDAQGNLYGTAELGGIAGCFCGAVFKLEPNPDGSWTESAIYNFRGGTDATGPYTGVIFDNAGNLYGTAGGGCNPQCNGTVFKLTLGQSGNWTESLLYTFLGGVDGYRPNGVVFDTVGNLYGTTNRGGNIQGGSCGDQGCGTVFELTPSQSGSWTKTTLYAFNDSLDGAYPSSGVTFDSAGNLYGETTYGGSLACPGSGCGVVFELTPESGFWKFSVAHTFNGLNGSKGNQPSGGLVLDAAGNMYGTTGSGGDPSCNAGYGCGTIFELIPSAGGGFSFRMIGAFNGTNGWVPGSGVIVDTTGNIYGTTSAGGNLNCNAPTGCGVVFTLTP